MKTSFITLLLLISFPEEDWSDGKVLFDTAVPIIISYNIPLGD